MNLKFEAEVLGSQVAAAQAQDVVAQFVQNGPLAVGIIIDSQKRAGGGDVLESHPVGELFADGIVEALAGVLVGLAGWGLKVADEVKGLLGQEPIVVAAASPFVEVDFVDGVALEMGGEAGLDLRQPVEPGEEGVGEFAVLEASVDLFADGVR